MKEYVDDYPYGGDENLNIDFSKYIHLIKENKKTIILWTIVAFFIGVVIALTTPRKYSVLTKLAPELSNNAVNRLASLSQLAGLNATMLGSTDAVYPMVYPDIVGSTEFIVDIFDTPVSFTRKKESIDTTLYEYVLNNQKHSAIGTVLSSPMLLISWLKGKLSPDEEEEDGGSEIDPFHLTRDQFKVAKTIGNSIEATIDKKTMVVTIIVSMQDPLVAAQVSEAINVHLQEYVVRYRTEKSKNDVEYYEKLYEQAQSEYIASQNRYARHVDLNQGSVSQRAKVEENRLHNEANLKYQLYNNIALQLQNAKAKVQQETPAFVQIIPPTVPLRASKPSRKTIVLLLTLIGFCVGCGYVLAKKK